MSDLTTDACAPTPSYPDLLEWRRNAYELRVLLGAIANMAAPTASQELREIIQLARTISEELRNDMDAST